MSILVDADSRVLIQGITGRTGQLYAERMLAGGTGLVGGVTPGKGGATVCGVPVFDSVREAVAATGATAVMSCVGPAHAMEGLIEAAEAGLELSVVYIENIPVHDAILMRAYAKARGLHMLGPNSAGVVSPRGCNLSDLNDANLDRGRVGIVSKSGTMTYEVIAELRDRGLGVSTVVCIGGDRVIGTTYTDILPLFEADPETDAVVLIGEPGGGLEHDAARVAGMMRTPVIAFITGQHAPPAARMGHAGAVVGDDARSTPAAKVASFERAGCRVARLITEVGPLVEGALAG
jgi:succinyl-CoA synthetase alpha subunit